MMWKISFGGRVHHKSKPTFGQSQGYTQWLADNNRANAASAAQTQDIQNAQNVVNQAETSPQTSPLYNTLLTTSTDATNDAYNNAKSALLTNANVAGFGYNQPVTQGGEQELETSRASNLNQLPNQAFEGNLAQANTQAGQDLQEAAAEGSQAGQYLSASENFFNTANADEQNLQKNNTAFGSSLGSTFGPLLTAATATPAAATGGGVAGDAATAVAARQITPQATQNNPAAPAPQVSMKFGGAPMVSSVPSATPGSMATNAGMALAMPTSNAMDTTQNTASGLGGFQRSKRRAAAA